MTFFYFPSSLSVTLFLSSVLPSLIDRLGDAKDQVRDQDQALLLKIMDQAANPQVLDSMLVHSNVFHHFCTSSVAQSQTEETIKDI